MTNENDQGHPVSEWSPGSNPPPDRENTAGSRPNSNADAPARRQYSDGERAPGPAGDSPRDSRGYADGGGGASGPGNSSGEADAGAGPAQGQGQGPGTRPNEGYRGGGQGGGYQGGGGGGRFQGRHRHGRHRQGGGGGNNPPRQNDGGGGGQFNPQRQGPRQQMPLPAVLPDPQEGWLEISEKGFGFLRSSKANFAPKPTDVFLTPDSIKRLGLREGSYIKCTVSPPHRGNSPQLREVLEANGKSYQDYLHSLRFENLTTITPIEKFRLETTSDAIETRVIDLVTPIGKGTRGLIVAPPRTGKTTVLKQVANAITTNHPDVHVMVLLIDERPEEVTDFQRSVKAEVVASSNDQDLETHVRLSRFMIERCRRMVEAGKDVFVLLDSITRVARAYNSVQGGSGRTMSGGVDARALEIPRKMFAAARKVEEGGSLTILATALVDTGSRMDELIFQEFKGTGNMELILDRRLSDRRLFPAIDIPKSGTRNEERLFAPTHIDAIRKLRRMMTDLQPVEAMETLVAALKKHKTNDDLLAKLR